jgi:hypothetical protein
VVDVDTIADFVMVHCAGATVLLLQEQEKQGVPAGAAAPWPLYSSAGVEPAVDGVAAVAASV